MKSDYQLVNDSLTQVGTPDALERIAKGGVTKEYVDEQDAKLQVNIDKKADITALDAKQNKLIAGTNITIDEETNIMSATGGGTGGVTKEYVDTQDAKKQDKLIAGTNITIDQTTNIISATTGGDVSNKVDKTTVPLSIYGTDSAGKQIIYSVGDGISFDNGKISANYPIIEQATIDSWFTPVVQNYEMF